MESSDYTFNSTDVTFPSGSNDSSLGCVDIAIEDDSALEGNQTFTVTLTTSDPDVLLENNITDITIIDNDSKLRYFTCYIIIVHYGDVNGCRCGCVCAHHVECG